MDGMVQWVVQWVVQWMVQCPVTRLDRLEVPSRQPQPSSAQEQTEDKRSVPPARMHWIASASGTSAR